MPILYSKDYVAPIHIGWSLLPGLPPSGPTFSAILSLITHLPVTLNSLFLHRLRALLCLSTYSQPLWRFSPHLGSALYILPSSVPTFYCTVSTVCLLKPTSSFLALAISHIMSPMQMYKNPEILFFIGSQFSAQNTEGALITMSNEKGQSEG